MDFFLKLIAPLENYDFSNFLHNFFLALPASVLAGVIIFFLLLAFKKLQSKEYRLYISIALILMIVLSSAGLYDFYIWEHDYGHNLDPKAIMKFTNPDGTQMGFQPPLFGSKDILNFKAHSYPRLGAYFLGLGMAMGFVAYLIGKKNYKKSLTM